MPLGLSPVSLGWHGNAVLVRKSLEVAGTECLELPGIEPRGCVIVRLATEPAQLTLVAVHLGLRRRCRRLQFVHILRALGRAGAERSVILGDFNEWSPERGIEPLLPRFRIVSPGNSFHASQPVAPLDRFALGTRVALIDAGVEDGRGGPPGFRPPAGLDGGRVALGIGPRKAPTCAGSIDRSCVKPATGFRVAPGRRGSGSQSCHLRLDGPVLVA